MAFQVRVLSVAMGMVKGDWQIGQNMAAERKGVKFPLLNAVSHTFIIRPTEEPVPAIWWGG